jgi:hypothetical protein
LETARRLAISGQMNSAGGQIQQNQIGQAAAGQKQIVRDLREIAEIFSHRGRQEPNRLEESVKRLRDRQIGAMEETKRFRELEQSQGELTRAQASAVLDLAKMQREIQIDTARLGEPLKDIEPIQRELTAAADDMGRAAASLDLRQTGPAAQEAQLGAIRRLDSLVEAIEQTRKNAGQNASGANSSQQASPNAGDEANHAKPNPSDGSKTAEQPSDSGGENSAGPNQTVKPDAAARTRERMKQLWGELPKRAREQMMQSAIEDYPPKYELRIEEYFRKLSEEKKR